MENLDDVTVCEEAIQPQVLQSHEIVKINKTLQGDQLMKSHFPFQEKRRGRKPGRKASTEKVDVKAKLERSRQSARECRARKKLRYQYLEELVVDREKAVVQLRGELERYHTMAIEINAGNFPENLHTILEEMKQEEWSKSLDGLSSLFVLCKL